MTTLGVKRFKNITAKYKDTIHENKC